MNNSMLDNNYMVENKLIGFGFESNRKDQVWWLTIYKSTTEDFESVMHFINDYYKEQETTSDL